MLMALTLLYLILGLITARILDIAVNDPLFDESLHVDHSYVRSLRYPINFHLRFWFWPVALVYYGSKALIWYMGREMSPPVPGSKARSEDILRGRY